jgi:hypothetical protein
MQDTFWGKNIMTTLASDAVFNALGKLSKIA